MNPKAAVDRRKFEAECVNDLWQSDVMHGPRVLVSGKRQKAYLIAILDDHSRLIPHAQFYLNERLSSYTDCLKQALATRGLPRKLYVDNGSAFRCKQLEHICACLGVALIHSKPYTPRVAEKSSASSEPSAVSSCPASEESASPSSTRYWLCGWRMSITAGRTAQPGRPPLLVYRKSALPASGPGEPQ